MDPMEDPEDVLRANRSREKQFVFDYTFDGGASQVYLPHIVAKIKLSSRDRATGSFYQILILTHIKFNHITY